MSSLTSGPPRAERPTWNEFVQHHKRLRLFLWLPPLLLLPLAATMHLHPLLKWMMAVLGVSYLVAFGVVQQKLSAWPCPRCGKPYFRLGRTDVNLLTTFLFRKACVHCGLPWQEAMPSAAPPPN